MDLKLTLNELKFLVVFVLFGLEELPDVGDSAMPSSFSDVLHELREWLRGFLISQVTCGDIVLAIILIPLLITLFIRSSIARCPLLLFLRLFQPGNVGEVLRHDESQSATTRLGQFRLNERLVRVILLSLLLYVILSAHLRVDPPHGNDVGLGELPPGLEQIDQLWAEDHNVHIWNVLDSLGGDP